MERIYRTELFAALGGRLRRELHGGGMDAVIGKAVGDNDWFTAEDIAFALEAVCSDMLSEEALRQWLLPYRGRPLRPRTVGVVMAGNIPLVGFYDLLCVSVCGHRCLVKPSSKDRALMEYVIALLRELDSAVPVGLLTEADEPDAVIATGSDNANRYFRSRYGHVPALLRGSRFSVAVLSGGETEQELKGLRDDMFRYFGLGCRSVSRLFVPDGYDTDLLAAFLSAAPVIGHPAWMRGYRQARALNLMNGVPFVDCGCCMLKDGFGSGYALSEIGIVRYGGTQEVERWLEVHDERVQCVVSECVPHARRVGFGRAQRPGLGDAPDGIDVLDFLHRI